MPTRPLTAPNFPSRWMSNFGCFARGICTTAAGRGNLSSDKSLGFLRNCAWIASRARRDRIHFLRQSVAFAGGCQMGKFKNFADGRAFLCSPLRFGRPFYISVFDELACRDQLGQLRRHAGRRGRDQACPDSGRPRHADPQRSGAAKLPLYRARLACPACWGCQSHRSNPC